MKQLSDDWFALGPSYCRRLTLYKLSITHLQNSKDFFISVGGRGGLIVFLQKPKQSGNSLLVITTAAGKPFAETTWKDAPPIAISWSNNEELVVVQKSGYATILNINGTFNRRFSFGKDAENSQIIDAKFFTYEGRTAVAVITGNSQIFVATSLERPRILAVASELPLVNRPFVWEVASFSAADDLAAFKGPWILLAFGKYIHRLGVGKAIKVDVQNPSSQEIRFSNYHRLAFSPNGEMVALYLDCSVLRVCSLVGCGGGGSLDVLMEFDLSARVAALGGGSSDNNRVSTLPSGLFWLDNSTLALQWRNFVVVVDMEKNVYELFYPSLVHIQPEVDGLRVLTLSAHEIIQRVPQELECLGRIGASCPAVHLFSAYREWLTGSGRAHEFLRPILTSPDAVREMHDAVADCLRAASHCAPTSTDVQQHLLTAAHFARGFLSLLLAAPSAKNVDCSMIDSLSEMTIQKTKILRLLNSLAVEWVGMALTWDQFESLGPSALLDRLLARKHYPLAVELVHTYQKLPSKVPEHIQVRTSGMTRILCHWVKSLLPAQSTSQGNAINVNLTQRLSAIIDRCGVSPGTDSGVSFATVAETAISCGHAALAERLLELEPRVASQIALLMRLQRYEQALSRAVQSGDMDLLLAGVLQPLLEGCHARLEPTALSMLLRKHPIALALYRQYLEENANFSGSGSLPKEKLASQTLAVLQQEVDPSLAIQKTVKEAFVSKDPAQKSDLLIKAKDAYHQMRSDFLAQTCEEAAKLVNFHRRLEEQQVTAPYFRLDDRAPDSQVLPRLIEAGAFRWQGTPVNATYTRLVAAGLPATDRLADHVRREFKMPEKRVAYLRLIGLALSPNKASAWTEIERMAFAKRPAVPLDVIVKVYVDAGRQQQATDIIAKLPLEQKVKSLILIGQKEEALNLAVQERSEAMLYLIQRLLIKTDRAMADRVGNLRTQISSLPS